MSSLSWSTKSQLNKHPVAPASFRAWRQACVLFDECTECKIGAARGTGIKDREGK